MSASHVFPDIGTQKAPDLSGASSRTIIKILRYRTKRNYGGDVEPFSERQDRQKLLESIHETIEESEDAGKIGPVRINIESIMVWGEDEGIGGSKAIRIFQQLHKEGYFDGNLGKPLYSVTMRGKVYSSVPFYDALVSHVTDKGLREIGRLPDPREEYLLGLNAAILSLRQDATLSEEEKRQKINWLQQMVDVGKQLTVEGIKSIWRGDIPPPGM